MEITFKTVGLDNVISQLQNFSSKVTLDAVMAVNKVIVSSRKGAADEIRQQVNFSASYLGSPNDRNARLAVTKRATRSDIEAVISARTRPTSLARFIEGSGKPGDVRVKIKPHGVSIPLRGAFTVRLRSGSSISEDNFNLGLAVRAHANSTLRNSRGAKQIGRNLFLLYGPSVDQVFQTVREDIAPKAIKDLRSEMLRLQRVK